jgi:hypothetical protein
VTDTKSDIPSVVERTRPFQADAPVVAAHFLGQTAVFVLGEEKLLFVPKTGDVRTAAVHGGAILCSTADAGRIVTGGDDGKVVSTDAQGDGTVVATDGKRRWIDHVAVGPNGAVAWSAGKQAFARSGKGPERMLEVPSTVGGLAFAPKGVRLAIAHYNGVTLWFRERAERARDAGMERLASRRADEPGRAVRGHVHAGVDVARLAPGRSQGHADVGLQRTRALARLDRRR